MHKLFTLKELPTSAAAIFNAPSTLEFLRPSSSSCSTPPSGRLTPPGRKR